MDREYVVTHNVVDRYLRGELTPCEQEAFEAFYLDDADTLDELEAVQALAAAPAPRDPAVGQGDPSLDRPASLRLLAPALVATAAVGFLLGNLLGDPALPPQPNVQILDLETVRGAAGSGLSIPADRGYLVLRIAVGPSEETLRLSISNDAGSGIEVGGLRPDAFGDVLVGLPTAGLGRPGSRQLRLIGEESGVVHFETAIEVE